MEKNQEINDLFEKIDNKELYNDTLKMIDSLKKVESSLVENAVFLNDFGDKLLLLEKLEQKIDKTVDFIKAQNMEQDMKDKIIAMLSYK